MTGWAFFFWLLCAVIMIWCSWLLAQYGHPGSMWFWHQVCEVVQ